LLQCTEPSGSCLLDIPPIVQKTFVLSIELIFFLKEFILNMCV
jgi:hypothetical protein